MKWFGTDGVRGKALEKLDASLAFKLGQALIETFKTKQVLIGYDTRKSSPLLAYSLANGVMSMGSDVLFAGEVSTPVVAKYAKDNQLIAIMITASHNPYTDNGIKVFDKGIKSNDDQEKQLEKRLNDTFLPVKTFGKLIFEDILTSYYEVYNNFKKTNLKIAFDAANGATYLQAPFVWSKMAVTNQGYFINPDGLNINYHCGSTYSDVIFKIVKENNFDLGFAYDGDGDRVIAVDKTQIYDGDVLIYAFAKYMLKHNLLNKNKVVLTKMSNPGIVKAFKNLGIDVIRTDVGDKYVLEAIYGDDLSLGGENSGHIIIPHLLHSGDGLLASVYLTHILESEKTTLSQFVSEVKMYPFVLENIKDVDKRILDDVSVVNKISELESKYPDSLILVRPSGTENLIRITASDKDENVVNEIINTIKEQILGGVTK